MHTFLLSEVYLELAMLLNLVPLPVGIAEYKRSNRLQPYAMLASSAELFRIFGLMTDYVSISFALELIPSYQEDEIQE